MKRKKLPEMINFDEVYAFRSDDSKYVCVLLDFKTHDPIDALPSRRYDLDELTSLLNSLINFSSLDLPQPLSNKTHKIRVIIFFII